MQTLHRYVYVFIASLGIVILGGCASDTSQSQRETASPSPSSNAGLSAPYGEQNQASTSVPIRDSQSGQDAANFKLYRVEHITSQSQFNELGLKDANPANFDNAHMVFLTLGEQPTGGYWVRITGLHRQGETLTVHAVANAPASDAAVSQSLTHPYTLVTIPPMSPAKVASDIHSVTGEQPGSTNP